MGNKVKVFYIYGQDIDEPLGRYETSKGGKMRYLHADKLGSIIALTDKNGSMINTYGYDPFGKVSIFDIDVANPFQFTGRENDNTGLYYHRARYYSPVLQRFISQDPIGFAGGDVNLYGYVGNNGVNFTDPWGLSSWGDAFGDAQRPYGNLTEYGGDFFGGVVDFGSNYLDMREANTINADSYFHCKANCESTKNGEGGKDVACLISNVRELTDQYIWGDSADQSASDQVANRYGRDQAASNSRVMCKIICAPYRPPSLSAQY